MSDFVIEVFDPTAMQGVPTRSMPGSEEVFRKEFRDHDWVKQVAKVPWSRNGWPGMAIERSSDGLRFWVCAYDWSAEFDHHEISRPKSIMTFIVGLTNIPDNVRIPAISGGRHLSNCDFLADGEDDVEELAQLYFEGRIDDLTLNLMSRESLNLFE